MTTVYLVVRLVPTDEVAEAYRIRSATFSRDAALEEAADEYGLKMLPIAVDGSPEDDRDE